MGKKKKKQLMGPTDYIGLHEKAILSAINGAYDFETPVVEEDIKHLATYMNKENVLLGIYGINQPRFFGIRFQVGMEVNGPNVEFHVIWYKLSAQTIILNSDLEDGVYSDNHTYYEYDTNMVATGEVDILKYGLGMMAIEDDDHRITVGTSHQLVRNRKVMV